MAVLSAKEIAKRIFGDVEERHKLFITPILEPDDQLRKSTGSFDIRLGTTFITTRRTTFSHIDPFGLELGQMKTEEEIKANFERYQEERYVPFAHEFILHPHQFALGCTLEYFRFPLDLIAYVIGRSSWGRLGLVIATATVVHPGYTGVLTLELENLGDAPITLITGSRIGQLVFHQVQSPTAAVVLSEEIGDWQDVYRPKYNIATKPSHSLLYQDPEREILHRYRQLSRKASKHL